MKTHLNLATTNLPASMQFYSALLDATPAKTLPDYALFIVEEPPLELALDGRKTVARSDDAHYGVCVESVQDVEKAIARLQALGLVSSIERNETCCYANQTKVWAVDPDGRHWEVYVVHEETEERDDAETACCSADGESRSCCIAS